MVIKGIKAKLLIINNNSLMYFLEILYLKDCPLSLELFSNISVYIYAQKILENMFTPILFALLELSSALKDNIGLLG